MQAREGSVPRRPIYLPLQLLKLVRAEGTTVAMLCPQTCGLCNQTVLRPLRGCYGAPGVKIPECTCHSSCSACGYFGHKVELDEMNVRVWIPDAATSIANGYVPSKHDCLRCPDFTYLTNERWDLLLQPIGIGSCKGNYGCKGLTSWRMDMFKSWFITSALERR